MFSFAPVLAAAAVAVLFAVPSAAAAVPVPSQVIVEWAPGASPAERRAAREDADVDFTRDLGDRRFQLVEAEPGQTPGAAIRQLEADPAVALVERDGYLSPDSLPDDPLFDQLWGLRNSGLGVDGFTGALAGADIGALSAWDRTVGTPATVVADIDSGYRFEHPDLAGVVWTNPGETANGLDDDDNGIVDDLHGADFIGSNGEAPVVDGDPTDDDARDGGHGVHSAGTIGAEGDNGIGITGVAQDVSIMPLRVCAYFELAGESDCRFSSAIAAINYAGAEGARVANMSFGSTTYSAAIANAIAANPETLFVVSAGNEEQNNDPISRQPCTVNPLAEGKSAVDNVICVAATDQADKLASFSNWGAKAVDLSAPGTQVLSTYPFSTPLEDRFEIDDFASSWSPSGADGGFARTNEAPLTSFGISDSPGVPPVADSVRAVTSAPVSVAAGIDSCVLEFDRSLSLGAGEFWWELILDGVPEVIVGGGLPKPVSGRQAVGLGSALSAGGELELRFSYEADSTPAAGEGAWIDNVLLRCRAGVGEADGYAFLNGTSMSAPHVTGAAALLFSLKPSATVNEVRRGLLGSVDPLPSLAGKTTTGGRLDAAAAVDLFDAAPPPTPALGATSPLSPSNANQPRLVGAAQRGTTIDVYASGDCSGAPVASGTAAQLAAPGIAVTVEDNTVTQFSVKATDLAPLSSPCSAPLTYTHVLPPDPEEPETDSEAPGGDPGPPPADPGPGPGVPQTARACVVPKLAGKTLAQAKAALRAAACRPGAVRKPKPRKGKRLPPLVVKSSAPAAGAIRSAGTKVNLALGPKPRKARR